MAATLRNSTLYTNRDVNHYLQDARDFQGRTVKIPIEHTVVSGEDSDDTVNLCVLPADCEVVSLEVVTDGLGVSAGAGVSPSIGDADDADRYMKATDFDAAEGRGTLAFAGMRYRPSVDTIVLMTYSGANPVVGKIIKGYIEIVPGA